MAQHFSAERFSAATFTIWFMLVIFYKQLWVTEYRIELPKHKTEITRIEVLSEPVIRETADEIPVSEYKWLEEPFGVEGGEDQFEHNRQSGTNTWHQVNNGTYVFTAYIDNRLSPNVVRIMAIRCKGTPHPVFCRFHYTDEYNTTEYADVVSEIEHLDNHSFRWSWGHFMYSCNLPMDGTYPDGVDMVDTNNYSLPHYIPIKPPFQGHRRNFTVCYPPIWGRHGGYHRPNQLLQAIEVPSCVFC